MPNTLQDSHSVLNRHEWGRSKLSATASNPNEFMNIKEIQTAKKRCITMGVAQGWRPEFDLHPLAASIDNHTCVIDVELEKEKPDYLSILVWIHTMAKKVNQYCDEQMVKDNKAAEYWLERFLWRVDSVVLI